ncbi:hypothetical protein C8Q79DRAFT_776537 [Trametes meyenii]|nr:hypothetical protein C8Q79DRAFT_776537 [Trametes meyenii]
MESLPLEILQRIFLFACTDGGSTGNALSLTSKSFRTASRRDRFRTLRLVADLEPLSKFVALYARECAVSGEEDKPRIRHLYLTLHRIRLRPGPRMPLGSIPPPCVVIPAYPPPQAYLDAGETLLGLVASDLQSLFINVDGLEGYNHRVGDTALYGFPILDYEYPRLREATFVGFCDPSRYGLSNKRVPTFPSATQLHFVLKLYESNLHLSQWFAAAPHVAHLRVTGVRTATQHVKQLAEALGVYVDFSWCTLPEFPRPPPPPAVFPTIRSLVVQSAAPPPTDPPSTTGERIEYARLLDALKQLQRECNRANIHAVFLDPLAGPLNAETEWKSQVEYSVEF